jgi:predicted methyltransferase
MSRKNERSFRGICFVHETLYGLFRDPYKALDAAGLEAGQDVLEVGCGPGFFTVPAARIVGKDGSVPPNQLFQLVRQQGRIAQFKKMA